MHKAVFSKDHARTVPKAAVPCGISHLDTQDTVRDGGETLFASPGNGTNSRIPRPGCNSSPLTQPPISPAGQTVPDETTPDDNIVDIGFPILDVRRLRIVREPYLEEDTRKVLREFDP